MSTTTFSPVNTKVKFLKEWSPNQFISMEINITNHFKNKNIRTLHGNFYGGKTYKSLDNHFGLAYTSSSMYAGYWVCNTEIYFDMDNVYKYSCFTIGEDGTKYAVLQDKNENELVIEL